MRGPSRKCHPIRTLQGAMRKCNRRVSGMSNELKESGPAKRRTKNGATHLDISKADSFPVNPPSLQNLEQNENQAVLEPPTTGPPTSGPRTPKIRGPLYPETSRKRARRSRYRARPRSFARLLCGGVRPRPLRSCGRKGWKLPRFRNLNKTTGEGVCRIRRLSRPGSRCCPAVSGLGRRERQRAG